MPPKTIPKIVPMKHYFKFHYNVLKVFGISIEKVPNTSFNLIYKTYSFCVIGLFFYFFCFAEAIALATNLDDMEKTTFTLSYLLSHILGICKLTLVLIYRNDIDTFCKDLEKGVFLPDLRRSGEVEFEYVADAIKTCNMQAYVFHAFVLLIVGQRAIYAGTDTGKYVDFFDVVSNTTISRHIRSTPFFCWFPFEPVDSPLYEIATFYQVTSCMFYGFIIGACDALIGGILCHIKAQFLILKNSLDTYLERAQLLMKEDGIDINIEKYKNPKVLSNGMQVVEKLPQPLERYAEICINSCVNHHQEIIFLAEGSEKTFNLLMLCQFLGSLLLICFQLFQLSLYEITSFRFLSMICYLMFSSFQVLLFCWHGNEVMLHSENLVTVIFNCNWIVTNLSTQKTLALMMTRSIRPIKITAGKFAVLSLNTFMSLIRGSGSYFMFLTNMSREP